jgi:signal transduction histidine kinase
LKPISELQAGMNIVGSGNLDYHVKIEKKNEVGDLSNSFNRMTVNLKNMTAMLQDQERMAAIGQTAGMVGHDLRNPLQAIISEVYLARNELQSFPEGELKINIQESVDAIEEQIIYMNKIVSDLQTFVKPVQVQKQVFNLKQFIIERLAENNVPENVNTEVQVQEDLVVNADLELMKRVLINLITNSIQAMPEGGKLNIKAEVEDAKVKIHVEDTGIGILEEIKPKLFTPLFTTKSKGQGFGLAVCKRVIEAHGGTIRFESEKGKGTKFTIELPQQ